MESNDLVVLTMIGQAKGREGLGCWRTWRRLLVDSTEPIKVAIDSEVSGLDFNLLTRS